MPASVHRHLICLLVLFATAFAQELRIDAPADRLVGPGEFATLVFHLSSPVDIDVEAEADSALGWHIVRQPGTLEPKAGRSLPVAITVAVPADAAAALTDTITLTLIGDDVEAEARALLTVSEILDLDLLVPATVLLEEGGFEALVVNRGNLTADVELELRRDGERLALTALTLAPGEERVERLPLDSEGFFEVRLLSSAQTVTRAVRAIRFGVPSRPPLPLDAELSAEIDNGGSWGVALTLKGALSDFIAVDARLDSNLDRSFLALGDSSRRSLVHLGSSQPRPFRLPLPNEPGLTLMAENDTWGSALATGWSEQNGFSAYYAFRYNGEQGEVAAGGGYANDGPFGVVRGHLDLPGDSPFEVTLEGAASYRNDLDAGVRSDSLDAGIGVEAVRSADRVQTSLEVTVSDGLGDRGRLTVRGRASDRLSSIYSDLVIPLGPDAVENWRVGTEVELPTALPGQLHTLLQIGVPTSFALARYALDLGGWRSQNTVGVQSDDSPDDSSDDSIFGVRLASLWLFGSGPSNNTQLGADLVYRPDLDRIEGRLDARVQAELDALELLASARWDLSEETLGVGISTQWRGLDWQLQLDIDAGYIYADETPDPFRIEVGLKGNYAFTFEPAPLLTDLAGGRNLGRIEGRVAAGEFPIEGVQIGVGRFRLRTDADGRFAADLEPGRYRIRLEIGTLPIDVRPFGPSDFEVEVVLDETVQLVFDMRQTARLDGRVLEDGDGDGEADEPAAGVLARLLLIEANGVVRSLETDARGAFSARGITPGAVEVRLIEQPFGNSTIGPATLRFDAAAGERLEAIFLSRPALAAAQTFGGGFRISRIDIAPMIAPPGAAPLLRISVRGSPERVFMAGPAGIVDLTPVGDLWIGRYPLPEDTPAGPTVVRVVASGGGEERERQARLVVDAAAPLFEVEAAGPVEPGDSLPIEVDVYLAAASVSVTSSLGPGTALTETEPGSWLGTLAIPQEAEDGIYDLGVQVAHGDGRTFEMTVRFRVLVPAGNE